MGHDRVFDPMMLDGLEDAYEPGRQPGALHRRLSAMRLNDEQRMIREALRVCARAAVTARGAGDGDHTFPRAAHRGLAELGGYGYVRDFPVERIWRDVRVCPIYEGTSDVQKILIQRAL